MLKFLGFLIKTTIFALAILIVANYFRVGEKTVSDQIKTQLAHAERAPVITQVKSWAHEISADQKDGIVKKANGLVMKTAPLIKREAQNAAKAADEEIPSSERQKLKVLMQELNSSHETN